MPNQQGDPGTEGASAIVPDRRPGDGYLETESQIMQLAGMLEPGSRWTNGEASKPTANDFKTERKMGALMIDMTEISDPTDKPSV
jgi:hypothetical protein